VKISDHKLVDVTYRDAADKGDFLTPSFLVMHFTAGGSTQGSVNWLTSKDQHYLSAHVIISREGELIQTVPFNRKAYHAGLSQWKDLRFLNNYSIGIELANWGYCGKASVPKSWTDYELSKSDCIWETHKYGQPEGWWEKFPKAQINAATELAKLLYEAYPIQEILGHDDISPGRKTDPGPAFPMNTFREQVTGSASFLSDDLEEDREDKILELLALNDKVRKGLEEIR